MKLKDVPIGEVFHALGDYNTPQIKIRQCKRLVIVGAIKDRWLNLLDGEQEVVWIELSLKVETFYDAKEIDLLEAKVKENETENQ